MSEMYGYDDTCVIRYRHQGEAICRALRDEACRIGFDAAQLDGIDWKALRFSVVKDPADGSDCLTGTWLNKGGYRIGQLNFNGDGSFFAEHDIVQPHPRDKRWFVEAVTAWGRDSQIKTEPRLLAAL
jgi:hypothetical protein